MKDSKKAPLVSVIIPTYNRIEPLTKSLSSLFSMNRRHCMEVIVIDNGSIDGTSKMLALQFPRVKTIKNRQNIGFAPALNQGIRKSRGQFIFVTNDDVTFDKNCLRELVALIKTNDKIAIVGGRMFTDKKPRTMALPGFKFNIWLGYHPYDYQSPDKIREMDVATGGCMLIRKSSLKVFGTFDPGFFFCGEDYDLCTRAKIAGHKVMYCPTAIVWHQFLNSGQKTNNFGPLFAHYRGKFRFMFIHATVLQLLFFLPIQLLIGPLASYWQSRQKTLLPIVAALYFNIKNLNEILKTRKKINILRRQFTYET